MLSKVSEQDGPGLWHLLHGGTRRLITEQDKEHAKWMIEKVIEYLRCKDCSGHAKEYYAANPLKDLWTYIYKGEDIGLFMWTWKFHNAVNKRIGKTIVDLDTALSMYDHIEESGLVCTQSCGSEPVQAPASAGVDSHTISPTRKDITVVPQVTVTPQTRYPIKSEPVRTPRIDVPIITPQRQTQVNNITITEKGLVSHTRRHKRR